jgi:hypothetical protein
MRNAMAISKLHPFLSHHRGCCQNHAEIESPLASCYTRILASGIFGSECVKLFARDKIIITQGLGGSRQSIDAWLAWFAWLEWLGARANIAHPARLLGQLASLGKEHRAIGASQDTGVYRRLDGATLMVLRGQFYSLVEINSIRYIELLLAT